MPDQRSEHLVTLRAELHIHTVLSSCAEIEMIPPLIVQQALDQGIGLIAITDHQASGNVPAVVRAAAGTGLTVLPGMELQTREEVHVLCLFDALEPLAELQKMVDMQLPTLKNDVEHFGEQFVVDETGEFIRRDERLLQTSAHLSIETVCAEVNRLGGMAVPAHVDRKAFGLIANLGLVPPDLPVPALEISRHLDPLRAAQVIPAIAGYSLLQGGDAHRLEEILGANEFVIESPTIAEIRLALLGQAGRRFSVRQASYNSREVK